MLFILNRGWLSQAVLPHLFVKQPTNILRRYLEETRESFTQIPRRVYHFNDGRILRRKEAYVV
jgi:hypothetical protein